MPLRRPKRISAGMTGLELTITTAENYRRFAKHEAAGRSSQYEVLAYAVAADSEVLSFLELLPRPKRQPNLLFAAARYILGIPPDIASLRSLILDRPGDLTEVISARRTQTNEPARCAVLLPALWDLQSPLALLEVGAAAGLTLLPDLYSYDYEGDLVPGTDPEAPLLSCRASGIADFPERTPEVAWRAGLDLNPLDLDNEDDLAWLSCLVWPGEAKRAERLQAAIAIAQRHKPTVHRGDLLEDLPRLAAEAPQGATLVIYHSAVLAYVDDARRRAFASAVRELGAVWLSNEGAGVLTWIRPEGRPNDFLLVKNGEEMLARTDPHGTWLEWLA